MIPNLRLYLAIGSAIIVGLILAWGLRMDHLRAVHLKERIALEAQYKAAQSEAELKAIAAKADAEAHYKDLANEADTKAAAAYADGRSAAQRYIDTHRVRACSTPGQSSGTTAPAQGDAAESADRSSDSSLVAVSADDISVCTSNSLRLQAARDWALKL